MEDELDAPESIHYEESIMPKWAKVLFKIYASLFLFGTLYAGLGYAYIVYKNGPLVFSSLMSSLPFSLSPGAIIFLTVGIPTMLFVLELIVGVGMFRLRRWTVVFILLASVSTILSSFILIVKGNYASTSELLLSIIILVSFTIILVTLSRFSTNFTGASRFLIVQIPLLLILIPLFTFTVLAQVFPDDKTVNDNDLVLQDAVPLLPENNAHTYLPVFEKLSEQKKESLEKASNYLSDENEFNFSTAEGLISNLESEIDLFLLAAESKSYQCPTTLNDHTVGATLCALKDYHDMGKVVAMYAYVQARREKGDEALLHSLKIAEVGNKILNSERLILIEYLVAVALTKESVESVERILNSNSSLSTSTLNYVDQRLTELEIKPESFVNVYKKEYMGQKELASSVLILDGYFIRPNKTINKIAALGRVNIKLASRTCEEGFVVTEEVEEEFDFDRSENFVLDFLKPNAIGEYVFSVMKATSGRISERRCEVNNHIQTVQENIHSRIELSEKGERIEKSALIQE